MAEPSVLALCQQGHAHYWQSSDLVGQDDCVAVEMMHFCGINWSCDCVRAVIWLVSNKVQQCCTCGKLVMWPSVPELRSDLHVEIPPHRTKDSAQVHQTLQFSPRGWDLGVRLCGFLSSISVLVWLQSLLKINYSLLLVFCMDKREFVKHCERKTDQRKM